MQVVSVDLGGILRHDSLKSEPIITHNKEFNGLGDQQCLHSKVLLNKKNEQIRKYKDEMRTMHIMKNQNLASKVKQFEKHKVML
jgi:hypothetical protein